MTRTRTEDRLQDALHALAGQVRDDRLRPLPAFEAKAPRAWRAWRGWLVPVAAAASVVLVIGLVMAVTGGPRTDQASHAPGPAGSVPQYFLDLAGQSPPGPSLQVRSTSTGAVVASAPMPKVRGWSLMLDAVAAAPDDRTFYAEYDAVHPGRPSSVEQVWIYRLTVTGDGQAAPLTRIKGGVISGTAGLGTGGSMAVSPGGTELAVTADTTETLGNTTPGWADKIIVIDLGTGAQSAWQGGMYRSGKTFTIPYLSWASDGQSLVYLGVWCNFPPATNLCAGGGSGPDTYRDTQVRSLSTDTAGGALDSGALLLTQSARYPVIAGAIAGPDGGDLTLLVLSGHLTASAVTAAWSRVAVEHVSAVSGSLLGVAYRSSALDGEGQPNGVWVSADPSGRYLLFSYQGPGGFYTGWISQGRIHRLPIKQPYLGYVITAW
jgi:hypothetical protein